MDRAEVGTERKDVGDQALIRGSTPHFRLFARGCLCLGSGVDLEDRPHILPEVSPTVAPSPPLHEGFQLVSSFSCYCTAVVQRMLPQRQAGPGTILLFDRDHPSVPTYTRDMLTRAVAVKDGPPSGHRFSGAKRP